MSASTSINLRQVQAGMSLGLARDPVAPASGCGDGDLGHGGPVQPGCSYRLRQGRWFGLACATPELLLGEERLENVRCLMDGGCYGRLESIIPPITVPAWMCMATS